MPDQIFQRLLRPSARVTFVILVAIIFGLGLLWLTSGTASAQEEIIIEAGDSVEAVPITDTDARGRYRFQGLAHGSHRLTLDLDTLPSHLQPRSGESAPVLWINPGQKLSSPSLANGVRFTAFYDPHSGDIQGSVFWDQNGNGKLDSQEPALADVRVIDPTAHQYFVPFNDENLWTLFNDKSTCHVGNPISQTLESYTFLVSSYDGTIYHYDHWEDGYDPDPLQPSPSTESGILDAGAVQLFQSDIDPAQVGQGPPYYYDGRDRITIFGEKAVVVRWLFPTNPGVILGAAWEVLEVADWGYNFVATVGEDLDFSGTGVEDHDFSGLEVMAALPDTQVYYNGALAATLGPGQTFFVNGANDGPGGGGVDSADTITATGPIQVQMVTGACGDAAYSAHGYTLQSLDLWTNDYWSPTPGFDCKNFDSDIYLHNPNDNPINVTATSNLGTASVSIPANTTLSLLDYVANNFGWTDISTGTWGVHLYSADAFWGMGVGDSSSNGLGNSTTHDWAFSLVPVSQLSSQAVVGYAPGNNAVPPTNNANAAFVTAITDTVVYVDLNQDGLPDPFDMDGDGNANADDVFGVPDWDEPISALGVPLQAGQSLRVGDPADRNLAGSIIYTLDYQHKLAAAWGQDICRASAGAPYLDLGYTILPLPVPTLAKWYDLAIDADWTGDVSPGDTITYSLVLHNNGLGSMNNVVLTDSLPYTYTDFVVDSLQVSTPSVPSAIEYYEGVSWDTTPISDAQKFRIVWDTLNAGDLVTITCRIFIHTDIPITITHISNQAVVSSDNTDPRQSENPFDPSTPKTITPIGRPLLSISKQVTPTLVEPGDLITYTVAVTNSGTGVAIDLSISDVLPLGIDYVPGTLALTWPLLTKEITTRTVTRTAFFHGYYADDFDLGLTQTTGFAGSDGALDWLTDWSDDEGNDPNLGDITVQNDPAGALIGPGYPGPGYLQIIDENDLDNLALRTADLSEFRAPLLRHYVRGTNDLDSNDNYRVEIDGTPELVEQYDGGYTLRELDLAGYAGNSSVDLAFVAESGLDANEAYGIDIVSIYETDPERLVSATLSWEQTVYTTTVGRDPVSYDPLTGQMVITEGVRLPAGEIIIATFQARAGVPLTNGLVLTNTAYLTASNWLFRSSPTFAEAAVQVTNSSHTFALNKRGEPDPVLTGGLLTYTLSYTASGNSPAPNTLIVDTVPADTTFVTATGGLDIDHPPVGGTGDVTWHLGTLLTATSQITYQVGSVDLVVQVDPDASVPFIANTAWISDETGTWSEGGVTTTLVSGADLSLTKVGEPDPVAAGETLTYTLTVYNAGPSAAQGVVLTDTLPPEVIFQAATPPYVSLPPDVVWDLGTVAADETRVLTVVVTVDPDAGVGGTITNTAVLASDTLDPDPGDEGAEEPVDLALCDVGPDVYEPDNLYPLADPIPTDGTIYTRTFHVVADKDWLSFEARAGLVYTLTTFNLDPDVDTVLQLYDVDGSTLLQENDDYTPGSWASRIVWTAPVDGTYFVRITHFDHTYNPVYSVVCGNHYNVNVTHQGLSLVKTAQDLNGPPVHEGDEIAYTLVVRNERDYPQTNVVIVDAIPDYTTYVSGSAQVSQGTVSGPDPLLASVGTLAAGQAATLTFRVTVDVGAEGQVIQNYGRADSDQQGPPIWVGPIEPPGGGRVLPPDATLQLIKTATDLNGEPLYPDDEIRYDLAVTNLLSRTQTGVVITDPLPAHTTYISGSAAVSQGTVSGPDPLVAHIGALAAGQTATFTFRVRVNEDAVGETIENSALADSDDSDEPVPVGPITPPGGGIVVPMPTADLAVEKSYRRTLTRITYTLVARNLGPDDGSSAVVHDGVAQHITNVSWTCEGSGGAVCTPSGSGNVIHEKLMSFPAGGVVTFTVVGDIQIFGDESNLVTILPSDLIIDPDQSNNTAVVGKPYKLLMPLIGKRALLGPLTGLGGLWLPVPLDPGDGS